ncbi:MAG: hypothetical protein EA342_05960 [Leptolyngbya sp. LCM1.Bin17]|nr:MAG: hypothetical protein EA342_05960 [Leptolyngbya sp. LCM1.Bin17]
MGKFAVGSLPDAKFRADPRVCPYGWVDNDDAVKMIWQSHRLAIMSGGVVGHRYILLVLRSGAWGQIPGCLILLAMMRYPGAEPWDLGVLY